MDQIYQLFLSAAVDLQHVPPLIISFMKGITALGSVQFYLLIMPALYWSLDSRLGIQMGILLLVSGSFNSILKMSFHSPRPPWVSSSISGHVQAEGFGFPSGHAQNAASLWGLLLVKKTTQLWAKAGLMLLIILIGLSRLFLGVHFIHDVLAGWVTGLILLVLFLYLEPKFGQLFKQSGLVPKIIGLVLIIILLVAPSWLIFTPLNPPSIPPSWIKEAAENISPYSFEQLMTTSGSFLGLGLGLILQEFSGKFTSRGSWKDRGYRYLVGILGTAVLYAGLGSLFPDDLSLTSLLLRFLRYSLIGLWITWGAPVLFSYLKLTRLDH